MARAIAPRNLKETLPRLYEAGGIRVRDIDDLALWFVEAPERLYYLSGDGSSTELAKALGCDEDFARIILRDKELYRAVMERMLTVKANPARMSRIYDRLLSRLEQMDTSEDSLRDVVLALDFIEKRMGNHPTLVLKGEINHNHTHKMIGIVYASKVPPQLLEATPSTQEEDIIEAETAPGSDTEGADT